ncbi:DUF559 domain-containing protein [Aeromicrobium chenweiae]|uniref:Uncharacterized protein n=1 Tax=Aeromicrobium chenweiae TaxID=2079793 RepID=A0A2S0WJY0_9ACTN|nr:DUF559 domain-containing protein [Aeromicrobium chenweiae]AWB91649.1 hypothetical protein C3E78_05150 [Aeromicrobium chenweiae]TGN32489.1 DUF559 domain-containing protein [Aeromicrobium chenweiae]
MYAIPAALRGHAFTVADAEKAGLTRRTLQGSRFAMLRPGIYRTSDTEPTLRLHVEAARLVLPPGAAASHTTALRLRGLDLGSAFPLHFSISTWSEIDRAGIVLHRRQERLRPVEIDGMPVLGPRRTFVDAATVLSRRDLLAAGDWFVARGEVDLLDLRAYVIASHLDGVRKARRVAPLVRERVASVKESHLRWDLHAAGLPEPELNVDIVDDNGRWLACGDLVYRRWKVLVEYDGWQHERDAKQRQWDHLRREQLEAAGWRVIVITSEDMKNPWTVVARVRQALNHAA